MKVANEQAGPARRAIQSILAYKHHVSGRGIRSDPTVKFMQLDRLLRTTAQAIGDDNDALVIQYGIEKVPGVPKSSYIPKDSPNRAEYGEAYRKLMALEFEVPDHLLVTWDDLLVRDENGELEEMELGEIAWLGPLLKPKAEPKAEKEEGPPRGRKKARG